MTELPPHPYTKKANGYAAGSINHKNKDKNREYLEMGQSEIANL